MTQTRTPLPLRNDTLFGVCEALGQDFGINPQLLRFAFALAMVWQPVNVVIAYLALGLLVLLSRLAFPVKYAAPALVTEASAAPAEPEVAFAEAA